MSDELRPLPKNREAEQVVLGCAIVEAETVMPLLNEKLKPQHFYFRAHRQIFQTLLELYDQGQPIDLITLGNRLEEKGELAEVGGRAYLSELVSSVTTTTSVGYYADIVVKKAVLRELAQVGKEIAELSYREEEELEKLLDLAEEKVFKVSRQTIKESYHPIGEVLHRHLDLLEKLQDPKRSTVTGLSTGFRELDKRTAGFHPADLIVVAGRPSMGKCLRGDQRVLDPLTGAWVPIAQLAGQGRSHVMTLGKDYKLCPASTWRIFENGIKPTYRLVTTSGREIVATLNHPFLTLKGWKNLEGLRPGDRIAVPRKLPVFGNKRVPTHQAKLLGYLLGDGTLGKSSLLFTNKNQKILDEFRSCVEAFPYATAKVVHRDSSGLVTLRVVKDEGQRRQAIRAFLNSLRQALQAKGLSQRGLALKLGISEGAVRQWFKSFSLPRSRILEALQRELDLKLSEELSYLRRNELSPVARWLQELGLLGNGAEQKRIPDEVFTWEKESLRLFLSRLFACDGSVYVGRRLYGLSFSSTSKELTRGVQHLLLRFGILTRLREKRVRYQGKDHPAWELEARDAENIMRFIQEIGIYGREEELRQVEEVLKRHHGHHHTNVDALPIEIWEVILAAKGEVSWAELNAIMGYPANHNHHVGRRGLSRDKLRKIASALKERQQSLKQAIPLTEQLLNLSESDIFWDQVAGIEYAGMAATYDLEVPHTHNFVAEDFIVHNSSFVLSIARNVALKEGKSVGIFSLEMTKEQVIERLLCSEAQVNLLRLRSGYLGADSDAWRRIMQAASRLQQASILIDDTPAISVMELKAKARRMKAEHGLDLLIVDYLQLVEGGAKVEVREQEISYIARSLKGLARELNIPVLACSQLSRAVERRDSKKPRLSDLRECLAGDTLIYHALTGRPYTLKELYEAQAPIPIHTVTPQFKFGITLPAKVVCSGIKPVFRLRTRTGREIRASANHPFLTIDGWRKLEDLRPGDRIAVPRQLPPLGNGRLSEDEARLLGYLIADGSYRRQGAVGLINADPEVIRDACEIVQKRFGVPARIKPHWSDTPQVEFSVPGQYGPGRNPLVNWLKSLGIHGEMTTQKRIPQAVYEASPQVVAAFIGGLWAGDGSVFFRPKFHSWSLKYTSTSMSLLKGLHHLLTRLGIVSVLERKTRHTKSTVDIASLRVDGRIAIRRFSETIPIVGEKGRKLQEASVWAKGERSNEQIDRLPLAVTERVAQLKQTQGLSWGELGYRCQGKRISRAHLRKVSQKLNDPWLKRLAESDLLWDQIISIEADGEEMTYDLVVPGTHNFVANDFVVHNSGEIEQTADVVLFLYRKDYYDEEPKREEEGELEEGEKREPAVTETEIIIGKQRNGPLGSFPLMFHKIYASFYEPHPFGAAVEGKPPF